MAKSGDSHETIIRIDHDEKKVYVWTCNRRILTRLRKIGATCHDRPGREGFYTLSPRQISLRNERLKSTNSSKKGQFKRCITSRSG